MSKPSPEQFEQALQEAERIRESGDDPFYMAKSLQYLHRRVTELEKVFESANRYLRLGLDEQEHAELLKALELAKAQEAKERGEENKGLGL